MKRSKYNPHLRSINNPYFALGLDEGNLKDEYGRIYSIEEFKQFVNNSPEPLDMTLMVQRLIQMDYDIEALRKFYKTN